MSAAEKPLTFHQPQESTRTTSHCKYLAFTIDRTESGTLQTDLIAHTGPVAQQRESMHMRLQEQDCAGQAVQGASSGRTGGGEESQTGWKGGRWWSQAWRGSAAAICVEWIRQSEAGAARAAEGVPVICCQNMLKPTNAARKKVLHNGCSVATIAKFK